MYPFLLPRSMLNVAAWSTPSGAWSLGQISRPRLDLHRTPSFFGFNSQCSGNIRTDWEDTSSNWMTKSRCSFFLTVSFGPTPIEKTAAWGWMVWNCRSITAQRPIATRKNTRLENNPLLVLGVESRTPISSREHSIFFSCQDATNTSVVLTGKAVEITYEISSWGRGPQERRFC